MTLPQIKISVISGALLAFITSLDEVVISLFIAGGDKATLTKRMFNALRDEIDPTIASISTLLIVSVGAIARPQPVRAVPHPLAAIVFTTRYLLVGVPKQIGGTQ